MSLHDTPQEDRILLKVGITTYHKILYEAMQRRRSPNVVTDELVNEALDRIAASIENATAVESLLNAGGIETTVTPVLVPPPPAVKPELCEHGNPITACRKTATCFERMENKQGQPPAFGPACELARGTRCRNPLFWRGKARCGCPVPTRRAA